MSIPTFVLLALARRNIHLLWLSMEYLGKESVPLLLEATMRYWRRLVVLQHRDAVFLRGILPSAPEVFGEGAQDVEVVDRCVGGLVDQAGGLGQVVLGAGTGLESVRVLVKQQRARCESPRIQASLWGF